jgi:hypothetical protein
MNKHYEKVGEYFPILVSIKNEDPQTIIDFVKNLERDQRIVFWSILHFANKEFAEFFYSKYPAFTLLIMESTMGNKNFGKLDLSMEHKKEIKNQIITYEKTIVEKIEQLDLPMFINHQWFTKEAEARYKERLSGGSKKEP